MTTLVHIYLIFGFIFSCIYLIVWKDTAQKNPFGAAADKSIFVMSLLCMILWLPMILAGIGKSTDDDVI